MVAYCRYQIRYGYGTFPEFPAKYRNHNVLIAKCQPLLHFEDATFLDTPPLGGNGQGNDQVGGYFPPSPTYTYGPNISCPLPCLFFCIFLVFLIYVLIHIFTFLFSVLLYSDVVRKPDGMINPEGLDLTNKMSELTHQQSTLIHCQLVLSYMGLNRKRGRIACRQNM